MVLTGTLTQGTDGDLYGTTSYGGDSLACSEGCGTVFKVSPKGVLTSLYSFDNTHGAAPQAGLVLGTDGNFYGTTYGGGTCGSGTVFKITPGGELTTLHSFGCVQADGSFPYAGLVQASDGNFYGVTAQGGDGFVGTVFRITPEGQLATLHGFSGLDGCNPTGALVQSTGGSLYGTTFAYLDFCGNGTIFRISLDGDLRTLLSFDSTDGALPYAGVIQGLDGSFYGTTCSGGSNDEGTVYAITSGGVLTTLYDFSVQDIEAIDGPVAALAEGTDGDFYGTTVNGGSGLAEFCSGTFGCGTAFKITSNGALTTLHSFCLEADCPDGVGPYAGLFQGTDGRFYGTTTSGPDGGTVYSLSVGLHPFVETVPITGAVGTSVMILGTNLTGTTSVTFDGTPATFTVVSSTEIKTTVPTGATTGKIQVVTPASTLSSNVKFRVRP